MFGHPIKHFWYVYQRYRFPFFSRNGIGGAMAYVKVNMQHYSPPEWKIGTPPRISPVQQDLYPENSGDGLIQWHSKWSMF